MDFGIIFGLNSEFGDDPIFSKIVTGAVFTYFMDKDYGASITSICISLLCIDRDHRFKERTRYTKGDCALDVILVFELESLRKMAVADRPPFFANRLMAELPPIITKYKFADFDLPRFENDFHAYFKELGWI